MRVRVRLYGGLVRFIEDRKEIVEVELPAQSCLGDLLSVLRIPREEVWMVVRHGRIVREDEVLSDGDEVSLFDPVEGG